MLRGRVGGAGVVYFRFLFYVYCVWRALRVIMSHDWLSFPMCIYAFADVADVDTVC